MKRYYIITKNCTVAARYKISCHIVRSLIRMKVHEIRLDRRTKVETAREKGGSKEKRRGGGVMFK